MRLGNSWKKSFYFPSYLKQVSPIILSFSIRVRFSLFNNIFGEIANPNFILLGNDSMNDSISVNSSDEELTTSWVHAHPFVVIICGHINKMPLNVPRIKKNRFLIIVLV